jgi:parallel beta-helix repeat protein
MRKEPISFLASLLVLGLAAAGSPQVEPTRRTGREGSEEGRTFYVRGTVGRDANRGLSPQTAWRSISKLSRALRAGDTAYVGPGLYRDRIILRHDGAPGKPIRIVADQTGRFTGDPPGTVMVAGSDPIDEQIFAPHSAPGVFTATVPGAVVGVVEMDGPQYRFKRARDSKEYLKDKLSKLEVVSLLPSSFFYDPDASILYLHTSDGRPPWEHEIELIRRGNGILVHGHHYVTIVGFTFRHMGDAGLGFWAGSSHISAINNISYGGRQGIRVYNATDILISGNTLFRNDNSGVYFAKDSVNGFAIGNVAYENVKGVRWSSASNDGLAVDNTVFDNPEAGIAIERVVGIRLAGNRLINNGSQLLVFGSQYESDGNCFQTGSREQRIALLDYTYKPLTLMDFQERQRGDQGSREGECGPTQKVDVGALHAETTSYTAKAREILAAREGEPTQ